MALRFLRSRRKPSKAELLALKGDYVEWHGQRIQTHREDENFFKLRYNVPSPNGRNPLYSPSGYQLVEDVINHIIAEFPTINILKRNEDEAELKRSEKLTSWINGYWHSVILTKLLRQLLWDDCVRGVHVLRVLYDPGAWPAKPLSPESPIEPPDLENATVSELAAYMTEAEDYIDARDQYREDLLDYQTYCEEHLPIFPQRLDPQYCFWEPSPDPKRLVVAWDRTVDDIIQVHPDTEDYLGRMKPGTKVQWCEYWDEFDYAYWIQGYGSYSRGLNAPYWVREPEEHGYGMFPYVIDGPWVTPLDSAEDRYPSIYYAIKSMIQYESTLLTQMAHMVWVNGWAPIIIKTDRTAGQQPVLDVTPGKANYFETEEDVRYLEFSGQTMAVVERLINAVDGYTQKGTGVGDVLKGATKGKSGYQQAQSQAAARVALVPVEQSTVRTLEAGSRMVLKMVRQLNEPVTVLGHYGPDSTESTIYPKDVKKLGRIEVRLRTVLPIDEGAKIANLSNMVKMGWISRATAARLAGVENSEDEHARWVAEDIASLPEVKQAQAMQYMAEHWPDLYVIMQQMMAQQQGQGGQPPNVQVGPGGPGGAGGGAQIGSPAKPKPPARAGSAQEMNLIGRQAGTGGMAPQRLPEPDEEAG